MKDKFSISLICFKIMSRSDFIVNEKNYIWSVMNVRPPYRKKMFNL